MPIVAIIPAFNEEKTIGEIIQRTKKYVDRVIVVNDGSTDKTAEISKQYGAEVFNHIINRGLGAALQTGFSAALNLCGSRGSRVAATNFEDVDIIVTLDADGQHKPEDIPRLIEPIRNKEADAVIGSRFLEMSNLSVKEGNKSYKSLKVPFFRRLANFIGNLVTFLFFGIKVSDSQSGFRAFSRHALQKLNLKSSGMAVSSEIIKEIKRNNLHLVEIPIEPIYTKYSMSKGQNFLEGVKTVFQLILRRLE